MAFLKKQKEEPNIPAPKKEEPAPKDESQCVIDDCPEKKQLGQNAYCAKHVRAG